MRRCPRESEGIFFMGYVQGEGRTQATLFPVTLEELIPDDHVCRVIDTFVDRLDMAGLGFERAEAAETGRPGVDAEHALIVAQQVTVQAGDNGSLQPMAEAAQAATGGPAQPINVVADAGYSNGEQAEACEAKGILPHVPANRSVNSRGDGTLFDRTAFTYQPESDTFLCPAGQTLA